ncbi:hypothetical protein ILYODFUR_007768 [Ilyodon furcidens]|uniref:Uncharacterized protein n=1 Tax=Ilyodon furcidens TaxID=33524 RepID=A0ABV0SK80_9TELE
MCCWKSHVDVPNPFLLKASCWQENPCSHARKEHQLKAPSGPPNSPDSLLIEHHEDSREQGQSQKASCQNSKDPIQFQAMNQVANICSFKKTIFRNEFYLN